MSVPIAALPEGTRVKVRRAALPQDPAVIGRTGVVLAASEYRDSALGVVLDGDRGVHYFTPGELEVVSQPALPPEREQAKQRRALP
ncbi:MAG TPA: hypothetical protein VMN60_04540 [Longimicrobiales bacterium]|nr:hypothetical protein [Longimicrobiales bacterium]